MSQQSELKHRAPALLLERLWPRVRALFELHHVPAADAERLIQDTLLALLYKWESIANHEYWLLKTLEHRCRRLYGGPAPGAGAP
jgi:DNA-directed RNA polymerase specialized sigma24 family protein